MLPRTGLAQEASGQSNSYPYGYSLKTLSQYSTASWPKVQWFRVRLMR
jgi:hypothetical protein